MLGLGNVSGMELCFVRDLSKETNEPEKEDTFTEGHFRAGSPGVSLQLSAHAAGFHVPC
jgi:hypothetical protein